MSQFSDLGVRGGGIGGLWGIGGLQLQRMAVVDLLVDLLGEGELDSLAVGGAEGGDALVDGLSDGLNLGDGDALLLREVLAADPGKADGLVHAGLDGLGVDDLDLGLDNGDHGCVVASLLGDLLAVVVAVAAIAVSVPGLADGHHHGLALLDEADLDSLGGGDLGLGLVAVAAHLVVDLLGALSADSPGDDVALLHVLDGLPGELHGGAGSLNVGGAHIGLLHHVEHGAVVLGVLVSIGGLVVGGLMVSGGGVGIGGGGVTIGGGGVTIGGGSVVGLGGHTSSQGWDQETDKRLHVVC